MGNAYFFGRMLSNALSISNKPPRPSQSHPFGFTSGNTVAPRQHEHREIHTPSFEENLSARDRILYQQAKVVTSEAQVAIDNMARTLLKVKGDIDHQISPGDAWMTFSLRPNNLWISLDKPVFRIRTKNWETMTEDEKLSAFKTHLIERYAEARFEGKNLTNPEVSGKDLARGIRSLSDRFSWLPQHTLFDVSKDKYESMKENSYSAAVTYFAKAASQNGMCDNLAAAQSYLSAQGQSIYHPDTYAQFSGMPQQQLLDSNIQTHREKIYGKDVWGLNWAERTKLTSFFSPAALASRDYNYTWQDKTKIYLEDVNTAARVRELQAVSGVPDPIHKIFGYVSKSEYDDQALGFTKLSDTAEFRRAQQKADGFDTDHKPSGSLGQRLEQYCKSPYQLGR